MERWAWWGIVHGVAKVRHDWVTNTHTLNPSTRNTKKKLHTIQFLAASNKTINDFLANFPFFKKKEILSYSGGSYGKESTCNSEDPGPIPGSGRSPGDGRGYPLQYSCLGSIPAWGIPWTEEPGGLRSMGLQRVRHDWVTNIFTFKL